MARIYKRDARGRFSGSGFYGKGGRTGKKNRSAAQALYKQTSGQVRKESKSSNMSSRERSVAKRRLKSLVDRRGVDGRKEGAKKAAATRRKKAEAKTRAAQAGATRKVNNARVKQLRSLGVTGMGARLKAKGFVGSKATMERAGGLRRNEVIRSASLPGIVGRRFEQTASRRAASKKATKAIRMARSKTNRTSKKAPSAAQQRYKEASGQVRKQAKDTMLTSRGRDAGRKRLKSLIERRGVDGRKAGAKKAAATRKRKASGG